MGGHIALTFFLNLETSSDKPTRLQVCFGLLALSGPTLLAQERHGFVFVLPPKPKNGVFSALGGTLSVTNCFVTIFFIGRRIVSNKKFAVTDFLGTNFLVTNFLVTNILVTEFLFVPYSLNLAVKEKLVTEMSFQKIMHYSLKMDSH